MTAQLLFDKEIQARSILSGLGTEELREFAKSREKTTQWGSAAYVHHCRVRNAESTRNTVERTLTPQDTDVIRDIREYLKGQELIQVDRQIGLGMPDRTFHCRLYVTRGYSELGYMFDRSFGALVNPKNEPDFVTVVVPEWRGGDRRILVEPDVGMTYVLGSDFYGEINASMLRNTMHRCKLAGGLGLHAGTKEVWAKNPGTGDVRRCGQLFFGLSGMGKTSLTCHDLNLGEGEKVRVRQDDVVLLTGDGFCHGTVSQGFYIKTHDLNPTDQKALYETAASSGTIFENVCVEEDGAVDFRNTELTSNGRAIVQVSDLADADGEIDMPMAHQFFFITRNPLMPPVVRLNHEQAAAAFMLGESTTEGEPVQETGPNPISIGPKDEEGNILLDLLRQNPDAECYVLNTGAVGCDDRAKNIGLLDTVAIVRDIARGAIEWEMDDLFDLEVPKAVTGIDIQSFSPDRCFPKDELRAQLKARHKKRRAWLNKFPRLRPEIVDAAY